jgi:hypothetical protein
LIIIDHGRKLIGTWETVHFNWENLTESSVISIENNTQPKKKALQISADRIFNTTKSLLCKIIGHQNFHHYTLVSGHFLVDRLHSLYTNSTTPFLVSQWMTGLRGWALSFDKSRLESSSSSSSPTMLLQESRDIDYITAHSMKMSNEVLTSSHQEEKKKLNK